MIMDNTYRREKIKLPAQDQKFFASPKTLLRKEDQVIVNIWSSADNKSLPGLNVGHVNCTPSTRQF